MLFILLIYILSQPEKVSNNALYVPVLHIEVPVLIYRCQYLTKETFRFFTVNAQRTSGIPTFWSTTHMQAKKTFRLTRPVCCESVVLNAFVNSVHTLKYIPFAQNHIMLYIRD